jgi:PIN domain nuclease of toxin-antitoxin system
VLLWAIQGTLSSEGADLIAEDAGTVFASAASIWEIEIKSAQGKLEVSSNFVELVEQTGFEPLPISFEHALQAGRLPLHHRDPFDRMLIAQARVESLTLASADATLAAYDVPIVAVTRESSI